MSEDINLTKILKNCPKGAKLYSTIFGEVEFIECDDLYQIIVAKKDKYYYFTSQGVFIFERIPYNRGECVLFPSKDQRDWSKFTAPWLKKERFDPKTLQPFNRILVRNSCIDNWGCSFFSNHRKDELFPFLTCDASAIKYCIPYNDDTKHLVGTKDEAPDFYRYWED